MEKMADLLQSPYQSRFLAMIILTCFHNSEFQYSFERLKKILGEKDLRKNHRKKKIFQYCFLVCYHGNIET